MDVITAFDAAFAYTRFTGSPEPVFLATPLTAEEPAPSAPAAAAEPAAALALELRDDDGAPDPAPEEAKAEAAAPAGFAPGDFGVADIVMTARAGTGCTWVSFPYAVGAPEILRQHGGRWDKLASAWIVPDEKVVALREHLPKIAEMVRLQRRIDAANGKRGACPTVPELRSAAGAATRVPVVGEDWVEVGEAATPRERDALKSLGCAPRLRTWVAPDEAAAARARAFLVGFREAEENERLRREEERQAPGEGAARERERVVALRAELAPVFGGVQLPEHALDALAEIAPVWPKARFVRVESRLLDGRPGVPTVVVTTPSGHRVNVSGILRRQDTRVSRRVDVIELWVPRFPEGAGIRVEVTTHRNGKDSRDELEPYAPAPAPEEAAAAPEPASEPVVPARAEDVPAAVAAPPAAEATSPAAAPVPPPVAPRRRGRKPKGEVAMSKAERNKLWRASQATVEVPAELAKRLRSVRDARGGTLAKVLAAALDALEGRPRG